VRADLRVKGRLTPTLRAALSPLEAMDAGAETLLLGLVADRAALHGFIARIEALGLELIELKQLPPADSEGGLECPACGRGRGTVGMGKAQAASRSAT
jgi:hypothetical protein